MLNYGVFFTVHAILACPLFFTSELIAKEYNYRFRYFSYSGVFNVRTN